MMCNCPLPAVRSGTHFLLHRPALYATCLLRHHLMYQPSLNQYLFWFSVWTTQFYLRLHHALFQRNYLNDALEFGRIHQKRLSSLTFFISSSYFSWTCWHNQVASVCTCVPITVIILFLLDWAITGNPIMPHNPYNTPYNSISFLSCSITADVCTLFHFVK